MRKTFLYKTNDPKSRELLNDYLNLLDDSDKDKQIEQVIEIKKNRPVRSTSANSYYWVILQHIASIAGHTKDELHEFYKMKFNGKDVLGVHIGQTTSDLDTAEFSVYLKQVKEHAKEYFEIKYIPEPEDRTYRVWEQMTKDRYDAMFNAA
jgi:hypothetical protein